MDEMFLSAVERIRRILRQLTELHLIALKDSPNGKRFAIRDLAGTIIDAHGYDLTSVYVRRGEWTSRLAELKVMREIQKRAFDEVAVARRATEEALSALVQHFPALNRPDLENVMERTPARSTVILPPGLLQDWQDLRTATEEAFYWTGKGGLGTSC